MDTAVIWSGVIGAVIASGISLFGVRSANKSSLDRLTAQLTHDADESRAQRLHDAAQKNEDRKAAIRREVYTDAIEQVIQLLNYIGSLPQQPLENGTAFEGIHPFLKANAKLWLVADARAAHLARQLNTLFNELLYKALPHALIMRRMTINLKEQVREIEKIREELQSIENETSKIPNPLSSAEYWMRMEQAMSQKTKRIETLTTSSQVLGEKLHSLSLDFSSFMERESQTVQVMLVKTVSALRAELHLEPDESGFMDELHDQQERIKVATDTFIKTVAELYSTQK